MVDIPLDGNANESISGNTGFIYNATLATNRKGTTNAAMQFNKADSAYISFDNLSAASFTNNIFTISFWVSIADTSSKMAVLGKRNMFGPYKYSIDNFFGNSSLKFDNWIEGGNNTVYGIDPLEAAAPLLPCTYIGTAFYSAALIINWKAIIFRQPLLHWLLATVAATIKIISSAEKLMT